MSRDRRDFIELLDRQEKEAKSAVVDTQRRQLRTFAQAEVQAQHLTGEESWDFFLSLVAHQIADAEKELLDLQERALQSQDVSYESVLSFQVTARIARQRIEILNEISGWPKQLVERGEEALKALKAGDDAA